jgi:hypothetical protein
VSNFNPLVSVAVEGGSIGGMCDARVGGGGGCEGVSSREFFGGDGASDSRVATAWGKR